MTRIKNHFSIVVQNLAKTAIFLAFVIYLTAGPEYFLWPFLILTAVSAPFFVLFWARTTIEFEEDGAVVESNILFKKKKTIPYSKVASVNLVRNIYNRIFGTSTLQININSSVNVLKPEASFVFDMETAERLRWEITSKLSVEKQVEVSTEEPDISFTLKDAVEYGIFGAPTSRLIVAILLLGYTVFSILFLNSGGILLALLLLVVGEVLPIIMNSLKYSDFKVYRSENQIHLQHGALQKYNTRFDVSKINAVRIRRPLFARLAGKACLEVEVIGINAVEKETIPLLCLLVREQELDRIITKLIPEFVVDISKDKQPKSARSPLLVKATAYSVIILAIMAYPIYWFNRPDSAIEGLGDAEFTAVGYLVSAATIAAVVWMFYCAHVRLRVSEFGKGTDMFVIVNGVIDRETVIIQYDRVQIVSVAAGPMPRRLGLARATVSLLSSLGAREIKTGYFRKEELSEIGDIMLERLSSGYDYRKTSI
ncbi:MAG: PH domain-containing protein [Candidatus Methanoplasma sp.]|jgi:putative membrane protein|nr:PH domain-containing protein [Candidatus Methanoplasma sp.]